MQVTDSDRGASLVEYALLVALIAPVGDNAVQFLTDSASDRYEAQAASISASQQRNAVAPC
jgi:Flp pilus assembly pilin Flp